MEAIRLNPENRQHLAWVVQTAPEQISRRARLILAYADGMQTCQAALEAGLSRGRARYWKREYIRRGISIFAIDLDALDGNSTSGDDGECKSNQGDKGHPEINIEKAIPAGEKRKNKKRGAIEEKDGEISELPFPPPLDHPGLHMNDTLADAGKKVFHHQFVEMLEQEEGTRVGENIEALHDMRVASRRLRAAFDIFGQAFQRKAVKKHLTGLRKVGRLLGSVRDLDVFMENAEDYLNSVSPQSRQGLKPLLAAWRTQLGGTRERLVAHFDSVGYRAFLLRFNYFIQTPEDGVEKLNIDNPTPQHLNEIVPILVYTRLASVRAYGPLVNNASIPQLHALRIELKKFRYALEFFTEILGADARQLIDLIKKLQDHLGRLHDADVACQILNKFVEHWDDNQANVSVIERKNPEAIINYLAYQHADRHQLLISFPDVWRQFETPDIIRLVSSAVSVL